MTHSLITSKRCVAAGLSMGVELTRPMRSKWASRPRKSSRSKRCARLRSLYLDHIAEDAQMLAKFQAAHPEMDFSNAKMT